MQFENQNWDASSMTCIRLASPLVVLIATMGIGTYDCSAATSWSAPSLHAVAAEKPQQQSALEMLSKAEAPTLAAVKPPGNPRVSDHYISEKKLATLPLPQQPAELAKALADLQTGTIEERKARLKAKVFADMVYVRGGSFMRGDFAKLMGLTGVTRMTYNSDDKVVKEITLSDFWISKYKVTYAEFDVFADAMGKQRSASKQPEMRHPLVPAGAYWQEAKEYCDWLGQLTGLPIDLPTEAQWEYAARSRGQFFMIPTDDGTIDFGRNLPYAAQATHISRALKLAWVDAYPVGLFPPNPLGLFDMSENGREWVRDWYAADAYSSSVRHDPQGPATGTRKVTRSWGGDTLKIGVTVWRRSAEPTPMSKDEDAGKLVPLETPFMPSLRCVVTPR
jgi:sulfatase modifying factor 1